MVSRRERPPLTQQEVQEAILALMRVAVVWARRSFENDEPRDRPADEALLAKIAALLRDHADVPLVTARGKTRIVVRESTLEDLRRYRALVGAITDSKKRSPNSWRKVLAETVVRAFASIGDPWSESNARRAVAGIKKTSPTAIAGAILRNAGFRAYRNLRAAELEEARAQGVIRRREASRLELIQYLLTCLQIPEEDLHGAALALDSIMAGGTLKAFPHRWNRRAASWGRRPPDKRPYYIRYGQPLLHDETRAELVHLDLRSELERSDESDLE